MPITTNIRSIKHAIALLGRAPLKRWLLLISFSKSKTAVDGMRSPVIVLAQNRAKLMSELASRLISNDINKDEASLTGILSLIDVITDTPIEEVLLELKVSNTIKNALLKKQGDLGILLELAISIETSNMQEAKEAVTKLNISNENLNASIIESYNI